MFDPSCLESVLLPEEPLDLPLPPPICEQMQLPVVDGGTDPRRRMARKFGMGRAVPAERFTAILNERNSLREENEKLTKQLATLTPAKEAPGETPRIVKEPGEPSVRGSGRKAPKKKKKARQAAKKEAV